MSAEPLINEAYNMANIFMLDENSRLQYINRQMAIRDFNNARRIAYNDGKKNGENTVFNLISWLYDNGRSEAAHRASKDLNYRQTLIKEYEAAMNNQAE